MIIGIGTDIVHIKRLQETIERYGHDFLKRCFTENERIRADQRPEPVKAYARLFAGKEALLKALGTGMREGLSWHDWEILPNAYGAPVVTITGGAKKHLQNKTAEVTCHLSLSDDGDYAVAYALLESKNDS